jgi:hypothetical protein
MRSFAAVVVLAAASAAPLVAQDGFRAGEPLDLMPNTKVFGSFHFAESCSYDAARDLYVAPNLGARGEPDGYVSLINPDGTVHTPKWIGVSRDGLTLNDPLGSDIQNGMLYVVDRNVVRWFDMETGAPSGDVEVEGATSFNDIEVATDGTAYMSQTGEPWRIYRLDPDGSSAIVVDGAPLAAPNGVAFDNDGNLVVVNIGSADILTFDTDGNLLGTEQSTDSGNDGIVVLEDGTKYVSSVRQGTLARIRPGQAAERVATGIPSAASICYDPTRERVIVPMNSWFSLAFVEVGM